MPLRVVVFGAHPDDDEIKAGGTSALWARRGDEVLFVSLSDGSAGHQHPGPELARRRRHEAEAAAAVLGTRSLVLDHPDGALEPTLALRAEVVAIIRRARADLVLLPRPWDYHPDHRATAHVVQDAAYMVTVPAVVPEVPHLHANPVFAYVWDPFTRPCPLVPDVAVDISDVLETKLQALHQHASQVYEWLPYNSGTLASVPAGEVERRQWLRHWLERDRQAALEQRPLLEALGSGAATHAELFEICELGRRPGPDELRRLFPLPA